MSNRDTPDEVGLRDRSDVGIEVSCVRHCFGSNEVSSRKSSSDSIAG